MNKKITFITLGDITSIATMKRALGKANPMHALGWNVSIIAMDCEENRKRISLECIPEIEIRWYKPSSIKDEVVQKTLLVKQLRPDYIYFCSFGIRNRIHKGKLGFNPEIIIEHSELASGIPDNKGVKKLIAHIVEYGSVFYADKLVCASVYLVNLYKSYAARCFKKNMPILYSPYAFNKEVIDSPRIVLQELRTKYAGKKVFLYMGTMTRNYGLFTMIDAAEMLLEVRQDFVLILMGRGRHVEEAKNLVKYKGLTDIVIFPGYTPEEHLSSYFELADAFISPLNDTVQDKARCPSKIYMYLPFQKPIFTCAIGEPKEIFGNKGYYFDNNKPQTLADLMKISCEGRLSKSVIPIEEHNWIQRSIDFDKWIRQSDK